MKCKFCKEPCGNSHCPYTESNVINLEDYRPVWTNSKMCCSNCQSVWVATFHIDTEKLECYNCGELVPVTKGENL